MPRSVIEQLHHADYDELITFINRAFGFRETDGFPGLLPGCYGDSEAQMQRQYAIREAGQLAAIAGLFPIHWHVGAQILRVCGVGGVSVAAEYRNRGLMSQLLAHLADEATQQNCDLMYLGGQRQRYQRFGWEKAGCELQYYLTQSNVERTSLLDQAKHIAVQSISAADCQKIELELRAIHDKQLMYCDRPGGMVAYLRHWHGCSRVARDNTGRLVGYVVWEPAQRKITELVAGSDDVAMHLAADVVASEGDLWIALNPTAVTLQHRLGEVAEQVQCGAANNWRIFNWPKVIHALLIAKQHVSPLPFGRVTLGVADVKVRLAIEVNAQGVTVEKVLGACDLVASSCEMTRLLFGPTSSCHVMQIPTRAQALQAWCPLPLYLSSPDRV